MIGDWVFYGEKPVRVLQLTDGKDYKHISPIPLTPEILEKNGFVEKNVFAESFGFEVFGNESLSCGLSYSEEDFVFETYTSWTKTDYDGAPEDWGFCPHNRIFGIRFVHELQHCLKMCNIQKNIEI